ncbi:hypothetical protein Tco_1358190 [Tanacetum coccineum]
MNFQPLFNDALTSKLDSSIEPVVIPNHIDKFDLKTETSLSECDDEEQNVVYFNDLFPFNIIYPDDLKSDKENDDDEIDIKQSLGGNVINIDDDAYAYRCVTPVCTRPFCIMAATPQRRTEYMEKGKEIALVFLMLNTWNLLERGKIWWSAYFSGILCVCSC